MNATATRTYFALVDGKMVSRKSHLPLTHGAIVVGRVSFHTSFELAMKAAGRYGRTFNVYGSRGDLARAQRR